jgi:hypothetical protein
MNFEGAKGSFTSPHEESRGECVTEPPAEALRTGLESCGLAAGDTLAILTQLVRGERFQEISRAIATGTLLEKRSTHGRRHVLLAVRRRYLHPPAPLATVPDLAAGLQRTSSPVARNQLLLPYLLLSDRAAFELSTELVLPRLSTAHTLKKAEVVKALEALLARRSHRVWSPALRTRWAEGLLSVLRDVGALGRGRQREQLQRYAARSEAFGFHLWGLYDHGFRGAALHETSFWRLLLVEPTEARTLVAKLAEQGWWKFTSVGGTEELVPIHSSLTEWLTRGLG